MLSKIFEKYTNMPVQMKASFWFLFSSFLQKGVTFITTPIFTRLLNTAEYGQYSVFNSWYGIIAVFVTMNLYAGVYTRGLVKYEESRSVFVSSFQGLCLTLTVFWTIIYIIFKDFWNEITGLTTTQMLAMLIMIWLTAVFNFWSAEQRVDFKYKKLVVLSILVAVFKPLLGILLVAHAEDKVTARILGLVLVEIIAYFGMFISQIKKGRKLFDKKFWKYALTFNIPLIPHYLSMTVLSSADRIMINDMVGDSEAGIYNLAYQISMIMTMFNTALMQTIEPWLYKKIKAHQISDISKVAYPAFVMIGTLNLMLIAFAPEVVAIFAPKEYIDAIWVIPPVAMSAYFMFAYTFFAVFEFYYSKTKFIAMATMSGAVLNVILNYIFINQFGYIAAGYTTLFCYMMFAVCHFLGMKKICKDYLDNMSPYSTRMMVFMSLVFMGLGFVFLVTYNYTIIRYLIILLLIIVGVLYQKRIRTFVSMLIKIKK